MDASVEARLPVLMVVILLVFGGFVVRLFQLQIIMGEVFAEESKKNSVRRCGSMRRAVTSSTANGG